MGLFVNIKKEILKNNTVVFTSDDYKICWDSLLLANFIKANDKDIILELGTGCGIIPLWLSDRGYIGSFTGIDIIAEAVELFQKGIEKNKIRQYRAVCCDMKNYTESKKYSAVVSNPPYFDVNINDTKIDNRSVIRSEVLGSLKEASRTASRNLVEGGRFYFCYPAAKTETAVLTVNMFGFAIKRLQFVKNRMGEAPWLAIFEARYRGGSGIEFERDLVIYESDGFSAEFKDIIAEGDCDDKR